MASTEETDKQIEIWKVKRVRQMMVVLEGGAHAGPRPIGLTSLTH